MDGQRIIKYGLVGSADILGILGPFGRFLAIEIKTGNAKQSKQQHAFEKMIISRGGLYFVYRSTEEALKSVSHHLEIEKRPR
jgi:hypothetical protein